MTQNLRITGTISSTYSNFDRVANINVSEYSLDNTDSSYAGHCDGNNSYYVVCSKFGKDGSGNPTAWYNFAAATAGQINGMPNATNATQDICPSGWHLPTGPNTTSGTDFNNLVGNTISGSQSPTTGLIAFNAVNGGTYYSGQIVELETGYWWSATANSEYGRYILSYNNANNGNESFNDSNINRDISSSIRCVKSE